MKKPDFIRKTLVLQYFHPLLLLAMLCLSGCYDNDGVFSDQLIDHKPYKFFVAGHTYGHPVEAVDSVGLFPQFYRKLPAIAADKSIEFGVFTGDLVKYNEGFRYDSVVNQLARYNLEVYKVPGNHDTGVGRFYGNWHRYFGTSWYSFRRHSDLYLFLDPNLNYWQITDPQLEMIRTELQDLAQVNNIFVFHHQILWWDSSPDSLLHYTNPNSPEGRLDSLVNFWTDVIPMFRPLKQQVYFFAGDAGAWCWLRSMTYYQEENIHLLTSGMGCVKTANYLEVSVDESKKVSIRIVALGEDGEGALGTIWDHRLSR
ncbi:MAG TPA: hypothetical protein ENJ82_12245 [Bacteroidetes bacterium]|nr:hypothetical protein [Bacteroidota bacterium]